MMVVVVFDSDARDVESGQVVQAAIGGLQFVVWMDIGPENGPLTRAR
jgi:hypothetical protein